MSQPVTAAHVLPAETTLGPASLIVADLERFIEIRSAFASSTKRVLPRHWALAKMRPPS
jgi:hypothetical protein